MEGACFNVYTLLTCGICIHLYLFSVSGDKESGKTTLLAKLQGIEDPKKGSGLDFNYIDIRDDDCEDHTLLSLAVLDGDSKHANLLRYRIQYFINPQVKSSTTIP